MLEADGGAGHTVGGTAAACGCCPRDGTWAADPHVPRAAPSQLPPLHLRPDRLPGRDVDAERRTELACLSFDTLRVAAGHNLVLFPDRRLCAGTAGRSGRGSFLPAEAGD